MPNEAAKNTSPEQDASNAAEAPSWPAIGASYWEALMPLNGALSEHIAAFGTSAVSFGQTRLSHNIQAATQLASCKGLEDVMTVQRGWFQTFAEDYRGDGAELLRAAGELYAEMTKLPVQGFGAAVGMQGATDPSRKR